MLRNISKQIKKRELTGEKISVNQHWVTASCIICKKDTQYTVTTPLNVRLHYVEGYGQLCASCHVATYCNSMINEEFLEDLFP